MRYGNQMPFFFPLISLLLCLFPLHAHKIAIISLAVGEEYQKAVLPGYHNKKEYCKEHGYDFFYVTETLDSSRDIPWSKIPLAQKVLPQYDWVFWSDADSLIMNPAIKLEELIDERYFLIICKQSDGKTINSGEFLIKNTPLSFDFLKEVYKPEYKNLGFWEQGAVNKVLEKENYSKKTLFLHQRAMNSIWGELWGETTRHVHYHTGDFILHFMGTQVKDLGVYMRRWAEFLAKNNAKIRSIHPDHLHRSP